MDKNYFSRIRILDGGMGQHLLTKGLKTKGSLWSATALVDQKYHHLVIDCHLDFIKSGADVIVVDGMQGGTGATQECFIEHVGIPTLPAVRLATDALQELGMHRNGVQLIVSGGIRSGADVAKAIALGADAVSIGTAALIALGDNHPNLADEYKKIGTEPGFYEDWQAGNDPAGITTQNDQLSNRLDPVLAGKKLANYLNVLTLEAQTLARACGKSHIRNLEPEDLNALTVEASAMARVPLAGTDWIPSNK